MITDWPIQSFSKASSLSGKAFEPGDEVLCLLVETLQDGLRRIDILASEWDGLPSKTAILGKWTRRIRTDATEVTNDLRQSLLSAEELFLSMATPVDADPAPEGEKTMQNSDATTILFLLALHLERQRVLRSQRSKPADPQLIFLHVRSKARYRVPTATVTPDQMGLIEDRLGMIFRGDTPPTPAPSTDNPTE